MKPLSWFLLTLGLVGLLAAAFVGLNIAVDPYGLYRPTHNRSLKIYGEERVFKYLLCHRYVPENFDAILIGSSMSANWDLRGIAPLRVYNGSLNGGNIVEGKTLVSTVVVRPGITTALMIVHPAMTASSNFESVVLDEKLWYGALGSLRVLETYRDMLKVWLGRGKADGDERGALHFGSLRREMNPMMKRLWRPADDFDVDPVALSVYRDAVKELRAHHAKLIFVVPPSYEGLLQSKRAAFDRYTSMFRTAMVTDQDEWFDFTTDDFQEFRNVDGNFTDGVHFSGEASAQMVGFLNAKIEDAIRRGRIQQPTSSRIRSK